MAAMMRSLSSCLEVTRMWRRTERASLEKKPSTRLSQEPCFGVKAEFEAAGGLIGEPGSGLLGDAPSDDAPPKRDPPRRKMGLPSTPPSARSTRLAGSVR